MERASSLYQLIACARVAKDLALNATIRVNLLFVLMALSMIVLLVLSVNCSAIGITYEAIESRDIDFTDLESDVTMNLFSKGSPQR